MNFSIPKNIIALLNLVKPPSVPPEIKLYQQAFYSPTGNGVIISARSLKFHPEVAHVLIQSNIGGYVITWWIANCGDTEVLSPACIKPDTMHGPLFRNSLLEYDFYDKVDFTNPSTLNWDEIIFAVSVVERAMELGIKLIHNVFLTKEVMNE